MLRQRRKQLGMSQTALADKLGLTFQQVQKYESGSNRMSASTLWDCAAILGTEVSYFFTGLTASVGGYDLLESNLATRQVGRALSVIQAVPEAELISDMTRVQQQALRVVLKAMATAHETRR